MKRKILSFILTLAVVFTIASPVFAETVVYACPYDGDTVQHFHIQIANLYHDIYWCPTCHRWYAVAGSKLTESSIGTSDLLSKAIDNTTVPASGGTGRTAIVQGDGSFYVIAHPYYIKSTLGGSACSFYIRDYGTYTAGTFVSPTVSHSFAYTANSLRLDGVQVGGYPAVPYYYFDVPVFGTYTVMAGNYGTCDVFNGNSVVTSQIALKTDYVRSFTNLGSGSFNTLTQSIVVPAGSACYFSLSMPDILVSVVPSSELSKSGNTYTYNNNSYTYNTDNSVTATTVVNNYTVTVNIDNSTGDTTIVLPDNYPADEFPTPTPAPTATPYPEPTLPPLPVVSSSPTPDPSATISPSITDPATSNNGSNGILSWLLGLLGDFLKLILKLLWQLISNLFTWLFKFLAWVNTEYLHGLFPADVWSLVCTGVLLSFVLGFVKFVRGFFF